jgi:hypothetical protein
MMLIWEIQYKAVRDSEPVGVGVAESQVCYCPTREVADAFVSYMRRVPQFIDVKPPLRLDVDIKSRRQLCMLFNRESMDITERRLLASIVLSNERLKDKMQIVYRHNVPLI